MLHQSTLAGSVLHDSHNFALSFEMMNSQSIQMRPISFYESVGGEATFARIVDRFYDNVTKDTILSPMYPPDLDESKRTLRLFLMQYFGGPGDYSTERGHPRLRMRHATFAIGQAERDAWMKHMTAAVEAEVLPGEARDAMLQYFEQAANWMMNR